MGSSRPPARRAQESIVANETNNRVPSAEAGASVQEASSADAAGRPVAMPEGERVAVIPVAPGQTIPLPFPPEHMLAKLGENGNLAVQIGDITFILQGYVAANDRQPITILADDGKPVDIADILAATDPELD